MTVRPASREALASKNNLMREVDKYREERKVADHESLIQAQGEAYYFDGKKDSTLFVGRDDNGKQYKS